MNSFWNEGGRCETEHLEVEEKWQNNRYSVLHTGLEPEWVFLNCIHITIANHYEMTEAYLFNMELHWMLLETFTYVHGELDTIIS